MIPKLHYISQGNSPKTHLDNIQNACASGAELVVLDIQNSSEKKFLKIATKAREITAHFQTRLIINAHIKLAKDLKVDGIHIDTTSITIAIGFSIRFSTTFTIFTFGGFTIRFTITFTFLLFITGCVWQFKMI